LCLLTGYAILRALTYPRSKTKGSMDFYSYSIAAVRQTARGSAFQHSSGLLAANSEAEAIGIATQQAYKAFPSSDGWCNHSAVIGFQTDFIAAKIVGVLNGAK
jgi:hypothetical protein